MSWNYTTVEDTARNVITASDSVLLLGTVALECMLLKRPMVVATRSTKLTG
ncbi:hypothetical protein O9929_09105 [Vibrio lentus]|nr:hypothetical protein [Vibrio lentus]